MLIKKMIVQSFWNILLKAATPQFVYAINPKTQSLYNIDQNTKKK